MKKTIKTLKTEFSGQGLKIEWVDYKLLKRYKDNPRINEAAVEPVMKSIKEFGFNNPLLTNLDYLICAGHTRLDAYERLRKENFKFDLEELNQGKLPIIRKNLTETQFKAFNIADNKTANLALWDEHLLAKLIEELQIEDESILKSLGFPENELLRLLDSLEKEGLTDDDAVPELPEEPKTKMGDIYQLGEHRLMCGDSTKMEDINDLMNGQKADLLLTDPPYGVDYSSKNKFLNKIDKGNRIQTDIILDNKGSKGIKELLEPSFENAFNISNKGAAFYCFAPQGGDQMMMMMIIKAKFNPTLHQLIWKKNNHVLGRVDYSYIHEPILYTWKEVGHKFYGGFQTSVLEFDRSNSSKLHPTMKPVILLERLIINSSKQKDKVLDLFLGSGSTLIACEKKKRICYGMEISPSYCDVIIKRWEDYTGKKAQLIQKDNKEKDYNKSVIKEVENLGNY